LLALANTPVDLTNLTERRQRMKFRVDIRVEGISLHGSDLDEQLTMEFPDVAWYQSGSAAIAAVVSDISIVDAACDVSTRFLSRVKGARLARVDEGLVGVADIARRVDVSRELVRLWSTGGRGPGGFPASRGQISAAGPKGATKIWAWADVNRWLAQIGLDDGFEYATDEQVAQVNHFLARVPEVGQGWIGCCRAQTGRQVPTGFWLDAPRG
jgi:hypothetical protein